MSEWTISDLEKWDKKICTIGEALGLDWYPIEYEICDYKEMTLLYMNIANLMFL